MKSAFGLFLWRIVGLLAVVVLPLQVTASSSDTQDSSAEHSWKRGSGGGDNVIDFWAQRGKKAVFQPLFHQEEEEEEEKLPMTAEEVIFPHQSLMGKRGLARPNGMMMMPSGKRGFLRPNAVIGVGKRGFVRPNSMVILSGKRGARLMRPNSVLGMPVRVGKRNPNRMILLPTAGKRDAEEAKRAADDGEDRVRDLVRIVRMDSSESQTEDLPVDEFTGDEENYVSMVPMFGASGQVRWRRGLMTKDDSFFPARG